MTGGEVWTGNRHLLSPLRAGLLLPLFGLLLLLLRAFGFFGSLLFARFLALFLSGHDLFPFVDY
jgi:hypothetical protein